MEFGTGSDPRSSERAQATEVLFQLHTEMTEKIKGCSLKIEKVFSSRGDGIAAM